MNPVLRTVIFTVIVPGAVALLVPWLILRGQADISSIANLIVALLLIASGMAIYLWCAFWAFAMVGRGTPAPFDAPRRLVVHGLYRVVRNPMYWGMALILLGEAVLFGSWAIARYAVVWYLFVFLFVLSYEEPTLRRKFGPEYQEYCRTVPRWLPNFKRRVQDSHTGSN